MRKLIVISMATLDGVVQGPGGPEEDTSNGFKHGGWTVAYGDEDFGKIMAEDLQPASYLLGRKTFDIFESYWPNHAEFWPGINEGEKYVLSNSRNQSDWKNTSFIKTVEDIEKLKNSEGADIHVWGSTELTNLLFKHDLVDELRIKIYPLILGEGKKLFGNGVFPATFKLTKSQTTSKGVIAATYNREGELVTGNVDA